MIEWCEDLDYEKYTSNWHEIATSNKAVPASNLTGPNAFKIENTGLGEFSFEQNPEIMQYQGEVGGENDQNFNQETIDQNIAAIQREQAMLAKHQDTNFAQAKMTDEL